MQHKINLPAFLSAIQKPKAVACLMGRNCFYHFCFDRRQWGPCKYMLSNWIFERVISPLPDIAQEWFYTWHEHMDLNF